MEKSFHEMFQKLAADYKDIGADGMFSAFRRTWARSGYNQNPFVQSRRVKNISSWPVDYSKDDVAQMLIKPYDNELPLRQVSQSLSWTAYPYRKIIKTYQDLLTYRWYVQPKYIGQEEMKSPTFMREYTLVHKALDMLDVKSFAHMVNGQAGRMGKVFYTLRVLADKPRNTMKHVFAQQIPQDWIKITGFNNVSKYTVAFNMMYFLKPGTDYRQFGDLFEPYIYNFAQAVSMPIDVEKKRTVFASKNAIDLGKVKKNSEGNPDVYYQSGEWFYWVYLPVDKVWTFEIDDVDRSVTTPFTGLMLAMSQIAQYEQVQLELVQNPLISLVTGEIPYAQTNDATKPDLYKLSPTAEIYWRQLFIDLMNETNTGGVGLYLAPAENLKLQQLAESPSATEVSGKGYSYAVAKAGLGAIIPTTTDNRASVTQISLLLESQYAKCIYSGVERMVNWMIRSLHLTHEFSFHMFGSLAEDEKMLKSAKEGMTLGILSDTLIYLALQGRSLLDDIASSSLVLESKVMEKRVPLSSTYTSKDPGRPQSEGVTSEGKESDVDGGKASPFQEKGQDKEVKS